MELKKVISSPLKRKVKFYVRNCIQSILYFIKENSSNNLKKPNHIVIVCKGNICRSVFAEYQLRKIIKDKAIIIESCGLDVNQGKNPPGDAVETARKFGLDILNHTSKGLPSCSIENADLILTMEFEQFLRLTKIFPDKKLNIRLMRKFAPFPVSLLCNIDDPYGTDKQEYVKCYSMINSSLQALLKLYDI